MQGEASGTGSVVDARGRKVDLYAGSKASRELPDDRRRLFRRAGKWPNIGRERFLWFRILEFVVTLSITIGVSLWLSFSFNAPFVLITLIAIVLMISYPIGKSLLFDHEGKKSKLRADTLVPTMLTERHCASCAYNLRDLPEDEDGCTVCPECGAAWRLDDASMDE